MPDSTKRILTDETGQDIVSALQSLQNVIDPNGTAVAAAEKIDNMTVTASSLAAGATPTATISEVNNHKHIAFGIPTGATGATPQLSIGTVSTVAATENAVATLSGTTAAPVLNLQIPRGVSGNESIDDTKGIGDTDYVWSADKSQKEVNGLDEKKAPASISPVISRTMMDIHTFEDGAEDMPISAVIPIEPVQDLHGYDHPWPAGGGKNLLRNIAETTTTGGITYTINPDGTVTANGTAQNLANLTIGTISVAVGDTYKIKAVSGNSSNTYRIRGVVRDANGTAISIDGSSFIDAFAGNDKFVTIPQGAAVLQIYCSTDSGQTLTNVKFEPMVCAGNVEDMSYAPYSNICPVSGWTGAEITRTGKNLLNRETNTHGKLINEQGVIVNNEAIQITEFIPVSGNTHYTLSGTGLNGTTGNSDVRVNFYTSEKVWTYRSGTNKVNGLTFTTTPETAFVRLSYNTNATQEQLEIGDVETSYEPFGQTYSITFPAEAGTVYSGTLTVNEDGTGKLVVDMVGANVESLSFIYESGVDSMTTRITGLKSPASNSDVANVITSFSRPISANQRTLLSGTNNYVFANSNVVYIRATGYTDVATFKTAMTGQKIVYELATTVPYDLTFEQVRTILGLNNIWCDIGPASMTYHQDPKVYVDTKAREEGSIDKAIDTPASVMSFDDGADDAPMALQIAVEPVQDLHGYDNPWPAGGGKNLFNKDGTDTANGYVSGMYLFYNGGEGYPSTPSDWSISEYIPVSPNTAYTISGLATSDSNNPSIVLYSSKSSSAIVTGYQYNNRESFSFTTGANVAYARVSIGTSVASKIQLESGSTATSYAPYSNICPISGWTGANVYDDSKRGGTVAWNQMVPNGDFANTDNWSVLGNSSIDISNNECKITLGAAYTGLQGRVNKYFANHKYLISATMKASEALSGCFFGISQSDSNKHIRKSTSLTTTYTTYSFIGRETEGDPNSYWFMVFCNSNKNGKTISVKNIQVFDLTQMFGSTVADAIYAMEQATEGSGIAWFKELFPKDYYPYNAGEITTVGAVNGDPYRHIKVSFPSSAGTVYGGTLTINKDGTGTLSVDKAITDLGSMTWQKHSSGNWFYTTNLPNAKSESSTYYIANAICTDYTVVTRADIANHDGVFSIHAEYLSVRDTRYLSGSESDFKTAMSGVRLVYELATPVTYTLTAPQIRTLLGQNNIWADTGDILSADYSADTKMYVDAKEETIKGLIADDESAVATESHVEGDVFICDNHLYRAIDTISVGETLVVGSNVEETTIASLISPNYVVEYYYSWVIGSQRATGSYHVVRSGRMRSLNASLNPVCFTASFLDEIDRPTKAVTLFLASFSYYSNNQQITEFCRLRYTKSTNVWELLKNDGTVLALGNDTVDKSSSQNILINAVWYV